MKTLALSVLLVSGLAHAGEPSLTAEVRTPEAAATAASSVMVEPGTTPAPPATLTCDDVVSFLTRHVTIPDGAFDYYRDDNATTFDPIASARVGHRVVAVAVFLSGGGGPVAIPYVYCPEHGLYEVTTVVPGATLENDGAVAATIADYRAAKVPAALPAPVAPVSAPVAPVVTPVAAPVAAVVPAADPNEATRYLPWLVGLVAAAVAVMAIREALFRIRPIHIDAADHTRAVRAFESRLTRDADHLHRLNAAVDAEEARFINRIAEIQKGF